MFIMLLWMYGALRIVDICYTTDNNYQLQTDLFWNKSVTGAGRNRHTLRPRDCGGPVLCGASRGDSLNAVQNWHTPLLRIHAPAAYRSSWT